MANLITTPVRFIGRKAILHWSSFAGITGIILVFVRELICFRIFNRAVLSACTRQIHSICLASLPALLTVAIIIGIGSVDTILRIILDYIGAYNELGKWLVHAMLEEIAPLFTALIILLRCSTSTIADIGLMGVHKEFSTLNFFAIRTEDYIILPRMLAFTLAGPSLAFVFCIVGLVGSFFIVGYFHNITFERYFAELLDGIELRNITVLFLKPTIMAIGLGSTAIHYGFHVGNEVENIPPCMSQGMMVSITSIIAIELFFAIFFLI